NQLDIAWVGLLMMMSIIVCISSFLLVGIFSQKESSKIFYYSPGLIERAETFIFFILMILFPNILVVLGLIYTLLVLWTTLYRF
ncbi:CDP-alcohol phosphatidyltransferase, partial [Francisella tularensis subsp. holarctica]|nr:CDP-alcohol phosphatidyltransferase [Francisella tularensis subsp. holarctica]